ncbi:MAG: multicopper oxidase domain-containing protein [Verrucomicrobiae bacterium]|nr:multicopper oxidase domain-containing protein [Verrucomicrobiae bacterium]
MAADHRQGNQLRFPPDWNGSSLILDENDLQMWPGVSTKLLTINGHFPGPTIRLRRGDTFEAEVRNLINNEEAVLHWHGLLSPAEYDGHPNQSISPGDSYNVAIPIFQEPSFCWYHAHTHDLTGSQVYRGLAGLFLIEDPERDEALGLPTGDRDIPLVVRDWKSNAGFEMTYNPIMFEHMWGYLGDVAMVNGTPDAWFSVDQGVWRFRVLNGCNARVLRLGFSDGRAMRVIASDGGLTGSMDTLNEIDLGPGQRVEILVSFEGIPIGASTKLQSLSFPVAAPGGGPVGPRQGDPLDLLTFYIDNEGGSTLLPESLPAPDLVDPNQAVRTRTFDLGRFMGGHTINGTSYEMSRIDFQVFSDEVEIWEFVNQTLDYHPMHSHGAFFRILSRDGVSESAPIDKGWRDTVLVYPGETVRVAISFGRRPGIFLVHCHNLEHEREMMQNFEVITSEAPLLSIRREEDEIVVSWPAPSEGWSLEASNDLTSWTMIDSGPVKADDEWVWRESILQPRFFRLVKV